MNGFLRPLYFFPLLFFFSCSGIFVNPDLAGGKTPPSAGVFRVTLPLIDPNEDLLYRALKDSGVGRIPEHDFYRMQETYMNLAARAARPDLPFLFFADTVVDKDITRTYNYDSPAISPLRYLETMADEGLSVYEIPSCPVALACAYLQSDIPIVMYGTVIIKKRYQKTRGEYNTDTVYKAPLNLKGEINTQVYRKLVTFDLITAYVRLTGPSQNLPDENPEETLFETRSHLNFKVRSGKSLRNAALSLYGGAPAGSSWVISNLYVFVPREMTAEKIVEKIKPAAAQTGLPGDVPVPEKVF